MGSAYCLLDGTPVFHPMGELLFDFDDDRICCGLCGSWFRALGGDLSAAHGWSADAYRDAFGLNAQRPLQAPAVSETQVRRRLQTDERLQAGMRKGLALADSGRLNPLGRQADVERGARPARQAKKRTRARSAPPPSRRPRARRSAKRRRQALLRRSARHPAAALDLQPAPAHTQLVATDPRHQRIVAPAPVRTRPDYRTNLRTDPLAGGGQAPLPASPESGSGPHGVDQPRERTASLDSAHRLLSSRASGGPMPRARCHISCACPGAQSLGPLRGRSQAESERRQPRQRFSSAPGLLSRNSSRRHDFWPPSRTSAQPRDMRSGSRTSSTPRSSASARSPATGCPRRPRERSR
jgi:ROS/MUCR transcriptional regulator protein